MAIVHFRVGEEAGKLIMQIAQEHLQYNYSIEKAVKAITDSMSGIPTEYIAPILKGDIVITVDVEEQMFGLATRDAEEHKDYPYFDIKDWYTRNELDIRRTGISLKAAMQMMQNTMRRNTVDKEYNYSQILKFIAGDNESILNDLRDTREVSELALLIKVIKEYIEKSLKIRKIMDWTRKTYPEVFEPNPDNVLDNISEYSDIVSVVMKNFQDFIKMDFTELMEEEKSLVSYIEFAKEINIIIEKGIEPVDLMDNWSAGWLSPSGEFYGLNGDIANMLHQQIADALLERQVIVYGEDDDNIINNPDAWLCQHGWVKIHGNSIMFEGCLNNKINKINVDLTDIQIKMISEYGQLCHAGLLKLGWRQESVSASRFQMLSDNLFGLYKTYFNFD